MDGEPNKGPGGMAGAMTNNLTNHIPHTNLAVPHHAMKSIDPENLQIIAHMSDMLNQLANRGINSILVTVGPLGDFETHGSQKGLSFLKDNPDIVDRFSKLCTDDVWTLIGAQKRFIELGRTNQNKLPNYNDKGDYPLDFSHERNNYFPSQTGDRTNNQDNSFVQGILTPANNQNKGYQPNFIHGNFGQYMGDGRPNYATGPFFQGGFTQGIATGSEAYPQPSFMASIDASNNSHSNIGNNNSIMGQSQASTSSTPAATSQDKIGVINQCDDDLLKEMLTSTPLNDIFKESSTNKHKEKSPKTKEDKDLKKKENAEKRKRERRPDTWQRNIKKKLKTEGKAYTNAKGKVVAAKQLMTVDCSNCKQKCTDKISEETRQKIFDWFWKLGSYTAQKEFVVSRVTQIQTKTSKRRHVHRLFSFEINGKYESVCKPFFSKTLGIGDSYIYKAFEQKKRDLFVQDGRGKHAPVNKTSTDQIDFMHQHLDRFLAGYSVDKPLPKNIHAVKWYDEYISTCNEHEAKSVSKHIYRKLFQEFVRKYPPNPDKLKPNDVSTNSNSSDANENAGTM